MSPAESWIGDLLLRPPIPRIAAAARRHGAPVYLVGGALRDAVLGRSPADLDLAVSGDFEAFLSAFADSCGPRPRPIGDPWRDTHRTHCDGIQVDVARLLDTIEQDLAKRDFTMNALAVALGAGGRGSPEGAPELIDLQRGVEDIARGTIRMVTEEALDDDPLRMLRALRYFATLDGFEVEADTAAAIGGRSRLIDSVAAERIQGEWRHLLAGRSWAAGVRRAYAVGLGERTLVPVQDLAAVEAWNEGEAGWAASSPPFDPVIARLAALLSGNERLASSADPAANIRRLIERRWPSALARRACRIAGWAVRAADARQADLVGWAVDDHATALQAAGLAGALALRRGSDDGAASRSLARFARRAAESPWVRGADLRGWGLEEGPALGALLGQAARGQVERRWGSAEEARSWACHRAAAAIAEGSIVEPGGSRG